ncbi:MAG: ferric reductase-like transmembrane domain-containing protein [Acidimicrobiales bacterium]
MTATHLLASVDPKLTWYVARASGIVDWLVMAASIIWGLALSTRLLRRPGLPAWLLSLHRHLGALALVFLAVHVVALLADDFVSFGPADVLVPFASRWEPGSVAWGIVAMYLVIAIQITSWLKSRLPRALWRRVHHASAVVFVTATVHGLAAGTDGPNPLLQWGALGISSLVIVLTIVRLVGGSRIRRISPPSTRSVSRRDPRGTAA